MRPTILTFIVDQVVWKRTSSRSCAIEVSTTSKNNELRDVSTICVYKLLKVPFFPDAFISNLLQSARNKFTVCSTKKWDGVYHWTKNWGNNWKAFLLAQSMYSVKCILYVLPGFPKIMYKSIGANLFAAAMMMMIWFLRKHKMILRQWSKWITSTVVAAAVHRIIRAKDHGFPILLL